MRLGYHTGYWSAGPPPGAQVGANAVVIHDVPAGAIAVGVPAQIRLRPAAAPYDAEIDDPAIYI